MASFSASVSRHGRLGLRLLPALLLAACAQNAAYRQRYGSVPYDGYDPNARHHYAPTRYYPPPGPANDPWGPYVREAALRYRVPEQWVRAVMRQESGGREQAISPVGAMGLMQVMPATYDELRRQHNLGADPYDPHNNILAGTAYIREMYDRFGAPGFLAAYNAGPDRVSSYIAGAADLPRETVNYLAAITPNLGTSVAFSGPLAVYAANGHSYGGYSRPVPTVASFASGCDVDAAYDPDHPCQPLEQQAVQPTPIQTPIQVASAGCDSDLAYDPTRHCTPPPSSAYTPPPSYAPPSYAARSYAAPSYASAPPPRPPAPVVPPANRLALAPAPAIPLEVSWGIQVGAFANPGLARAVAEGARTEAPDQLRSATLAFPPTTPFGGNVLYRARLLHLSAGAAASACQHLNQRQLPCIVVPPTTS